MKMPSVTVSYGCPECGRAVYRRTRRSDGNPFLGCSGYPGCRYTAPYDAREQALAKRGDELEARLEALEDSSGVSAKDIRDVLVWAHPDKHPSGTLSVHEVAVRLSALFDQARGSA
jgi:ssDNA-binding Zn-finger/Zn-ribbon topoisomerase 1